MKKRTGFVSNSSSSSFVFGVPKDLLKDKPFSSLIVVKPDVYKELKKEWRVENPEVHSIIDKAIEKYSVKRKNIPDRIKIGKKIYSDKDLSNVFLERSGSWIVPKYFELEMARISNVYMSKIFEIFKEIHKESELLYGEFGGDGRVDSPGYFERSFELYENLDYCWFSNH